MNHLPLLVVDDPRTTVALYRETNPMLEDGFWPNGREIWENLPDWVPDAIKPRTIREQKKEIILNNGARIKYKQCADPKQAKKDAQGQETTLYLLDEATQLKWEFTEYLMSRLRSRSKHFSRIVMSCNPDPDHELRSFIDWWIDEDGYPIREMDGKIRYMFKFDGEHVWASSKEELAEKTGVPEEDWDVKFLSVSFVSATIDDNPIMDEINPTYRAWLEGLNPTDKAQLLHGNWDARPQGANYWRREWVKEITTHDMPSNVTCCRAYDLAATERSQVNKNPDPTACAKLYKDSEGYFYMAGEYHKDFYDDVLQVYGQFCKTSGDRDNHIIKQAELDGDDCMIILPIDPGAAGKSSFNSMSSRIISEGFRCKSDPMPINKSKLVRFQGFATACEIGKVFVLVDTFDKKTLEFIRKQLEAFNGERSTATRKDEFPDVFATAFNHLSTARVIKPFTPVQISAPTKLSQYRG
ncbi:terminase large subunit [Pseudoalteromonas phage PH357]|nr:terminase large subunit [Pseudoalteromonas phage PH357]